LKNKIIVIPNGIDLEGFNISDRIDKENIILFVSRLHPKKGIEVLLDAIFLLKDKLNSKWKVEIYGSGEPNYVNNLKKTIELKGLEGIVKIYEPIYGDLKIKKIRSSKLLVLPSYSENFGNIIAESLACETPVLTTTNTPWEELFEFNCGWYIELGVNHLKIAIENAIAKSDSELLTMGLNGRKLIENKYDYRVIANTFKDLYMHVLHNSDKSNLNIF
jgi:glycosyltransferase involved in cell wall biosynthesis